MRADRLIALVLLLQRRGRITAAEAAAELEVSPRTARRDLEALAMAGVPVFSTHGRGGGWQLIGGASTDLTGLSADESRALFLAAGPALAKSPELRSALRKLTGALPEPFQAEAEAATAAVKIDPAGWGAIRRRGTPTHLEQLTDAVIRSCQIDLDYESPRSARRMRVVHPLGLVTKRNVWYLVAAVDGRARPSPRPPRPREMALRTYRVGRVRSVELLDQPVVRPPDFDLDEAWASIVTEVESKRATVRVVALIDESMLTPIRWMFNDQLVGEEPFDEGQTPGGARRWRVTIAAYSERSFAGQVAGLGDRMELLEAPDGVFTELGRVAEQLAARYLTGTAGSGRPSP